MKKYYFTDFIMIKITVNILENLLPNDKFT